MHILGEMGKALTGARAELGEYAPRIETMKIPTDKIREVIGTGGKVIREIVEKTGAKINIEDDGTVMVASADGESIRAALKWIKSIVAAVAEVGQIYDGTVVKTMEFGAFVNFFGSKDGLVHISQLGKGRVAKTTDVVKEGDKVKVKLMGFDDRGKVKLSMRAVDQQTGEDLEKKDKEAAEPAAPAKGIQVTDNALKRIRSAMVKENVSPEQGGLRLGVQGGGCSGLSYNIRFDTQPRERDRVFQFGDVRIFVDPKSFIYLHGMTLDYQETLMQQGFVFVNPNATKSCGCGSSFS